MIKAVIFDMDGTVSISRDYDYEGWDRIFPQIGNTLTEEIFDGFQGAKGSDVVRKYAKRKVSDQEAEALANKKEEYFLELAREKGMKEIAGIRELLERLRNNGYHIGLGTSGPREKIDFILSSLKLTPYFQTIISLEDLTKGKPDPQVFLKAAEKLGCNAEECLVIEDAANGIEAAKNGGMKAIGITTTQTSEDLKDADKVIDSYEELTIEVIKSL